MVGAKQRFDKRTYRIVLATWTYSYLPYKSLSHNGRDNMHPTRCILSNGVDSLRKPMEALSVAEFQLNLRRMVIYLSCKTSIDVRLIDVTRA